MRVLIVEDDPELAGLLRDGLRAQSIDPTLAVTFADGREPGSAEGKIVIDKSLWRGQEIRGLTLVFSQGKLTSMTAASGLAPLKAAYDAAGSGKDRFGVIDIGLNPEVAFPLATGAIVWPRAGAVTIIFGNDVFAGGGNNSDFGFAAQLGGASITVGGKPVVERGRLK